MSRNLRIGLKAKHLTANRFDAQIGQRFVPDRRVSELQAPAGDHDEFSRNRIRAKFQLR